MKQQKVFFLVAAVAILASTSALISGTGGPSQKANVIDVVQSDQSISSLLLIDADTDESLGEFTDGTVIDISGDRHYTIEALTNPSQVGSVKFQVNGKKRSDSKAPYALYRDNDQGNYYPASLEVGEYEFAATPFTKSKAKGLAGKSLSIHFSVIDGTDTQVAHSPDHPSNNLKVFLGGPYDETTGRMSTSLNDANLIPLTEPYTALGYSLTSGAGTTTQNSVFTPTGDDAIVDWIIVELRNSTNPANVVASKPALVEADGDVMSTDGMTPVLGTFTPGTYYVAVHHRNHLAVMTAMAMDIAGVVDLSTEPLYGSNAAKTVNGIHVLWPGDVNGDKKVQYTGSGNDRDLILTAVGSNTPNNQVFTTYSRTDVNMDGTIKYTGSKNDRDPILISVGSTTPSNVIYEQIPVTSTGTTYYASPTGTGSGLTISTPFKISNFWSVATPGSTLFLLDGVYTGANSMIDPPDNLSGTAGNPITVKAMNDGAVDINGQGLNKPVNLSYNNWFVLEGFDAYDSSGSVVSLAYSSNNIVRRVVAWKAPMNIGDNNIFGVHHGDNNLLEDVAGFGSGARKTFSNSQEGNNTTFRRAFARWEGSKMSGPKKPFALSYNSYGARCENCIGTWDSLGMPATYNLLEYNGTQVSPTQSFTNYTVQQPSGIFGHDGFDQSFLDNGNPDNANIKILGSIAYLKPDQRFHNVTSPSRDWAGPFALEIKGVELENSVGIIEPGSHTNIRNPYLGDVGGAGFNSATNNTFISSAGASINSQWSTSNNYTASNCSAITSNGGNIVNNLGISGGATIMKRYVDGVLTNDDLWPWPMNQRIVEAMTTAGYASDKIIDVTATINGLCGATAGSGPSQSEIVAQSLQWLAASGAARTALEPNLAAWNTSIDAVIDQVQPHNYTTQPTGEVFNQQFTIPTLVTKYPGWNDPFTPATENYKPEFNMVVPSNYNPSTPMGIMFFLHWGGGFDPTDLDDPTTPDPNDSYITEWVLDDEPPTGPSRSVVRKESDNSNYIVVAPVAPFGSMIPAGTNPSNNYYQHASRWNVPTADEYLIDIITEIASRYNIDYNKIVVTGSSMGGIGAYHMAHRLNDRLAAVMSNGGSWTLGSWASITDLPVYTVHGTNDAYWGGSSSSCRNHMTAVEFPRKAHQLMGANNPNDTLTEYPQIPGHGFDTSYNTTEPGALAWKAFVNGTQGLVHGYTRNPYRNHVIAINPWRTYQTGGNYEHTWNEDPSPHTMWLSINSYGTGTIPYDRVTPQGDGGCTSQANWNNWSLISDTVNVQGGKAEATNAGNNVINVTTNNVTNLSVWLHPNMVNFAQPITLNINGNSIQRTCTGSLLTALKSYERRKDWNMIYTCELPININSSGVPI